MKKLINPYFFVVIKSRSLWVLRGLLILICSACHKESRSPELPNGALKAGSVFIAGPNQGDTFDFQVPVRKDSVITLRFSAGITEKIPSGTYSASFSVDTSLISKYTAKYGNALLLPTSNYFIFKNTVKLGPDSLRSTAAQINVLLQSQLKGLTTYVLPVHLQNVNGNTNAIDLSRNVAFLKIHTGENPFVNRSDWMVSRVSFEEEPDLAKNVFDNDLNSRWITNQFGRPEEAYFLEIDMGQVHPLISINYRIVYGDEGYPTKISIETSLDGTQWESKGVFSGSPSADTKILGFRKSNARYFRFTILEYSGYRMRISDIKAMQE